MIQHNIKYSILLFMLCITSSWLSAQTQFISLDKAIQIAKQNYAGLDRDRLRISQYEQLAKSGVLKSPTQISYIAEELDPNGASGVHSIDIQQNFYLPKVSQAQREYYKKGAQLAEKQFRLTDKELEWQIKKAFYQLLYAKEARDVFEENVSIFQEFLNVATKHFNSGETGKLPQLSAKSSLGQAQLAEEHSLEKYQIAHSIFNQWLGSDSLYNIVGKLSKNELGLITTDISNIPHLQVYQAQTEMAASKIDLEKAKLLPQINSGIRLQTASGNFPLFGYQMGLKIPLFNKAYKDRIEAAKLEVKIQEANYKTEEQNLKRIISDLGFRLKHQIHVLKYLEEDLRPVVMEQNEANLKAYREGEINYLEYLNSLEQIVLVKQQYLEALYEFNALQIEMNHWIQN